MPGSGTAIYLNKTETIYISGYIRTFGVDGCL